VAFLASHEETSAGARHVRAGVVVASDENRGIAPDLSLKAISDESSEVVRLCALHPARRA